MAPADCGDCNNYMHGWTCTSNTSQFPPLKSTCKSELSETAPQPVLESKTVAETSLLVLRDLTFLNKFVFCGGKTQKGSGCHCFLRLPISNSLSELSMMLRVSQPLSDCPSPVCRVKQCSAIRCDIPEGSC